MFRPHNAFRLTGMLIAGLALYLLIGCADDSAPAKPASPEANTPKTQRIVCFSPAVTQMLADLEVTDRIVGVGAYDPVAPEGSAVVGDLYRIDYEKLLTLEPTDIILQINSPDLPGRGIPDRLAELAESHDWSLHTFVIKSADDVMTALHDTDGPDIGSVIDRPAAAQKLRDRIDRELTDLAEQTRSDDPTRVLMVVGLSPITCVGRGTFMDALLTRAGGSNVLSKTEGAYPTIDREKMLTLDPQVIVMFRPDRGTAAVATHASDQSDALNLPPGVDVPVVIIDDPRALLPTTSMPHIARQLAAAIGTLRVAQSPSAVGESTSAQPGAAVPQTTPDTR